MGLEEKLKWKDVGREARKTYGPLDFLREHYKSLTRGELKKQDSSLYDHLRWKGLLGEVPIQQRRSFGSNPAEYYNKHYAGLTRGELARENRALYQCLWKEGLLACVPVRQKQREHRDFGPGPLSYYRKHYAGLTRGELIERDKSLYNSLQRRGLLGHVPVQQRDFGDDPVRYYREHYESLTRGKLKREDPSLYHRLWRDGLLEHVPRAGRFGRVSRFGDDPLAYYRERHKSLTRGALAREVPGLYQSLRRAGLLWHVPLKRPA